MELRKVVAIAPGCWPPGQEVDIVDETHAVHLHVLGVAEAYEFCIVERYKIDEIGEPWGIPEVI